MNFISELNLILLILLQGKNEKKETGKMENLANGQRPSQRLCETER